MGAPYAEKRIGLKRNCDTSHPAFLYTHPGALVLLVGRPSGPHHIL
jgi:hypothetical protein